MINKRKQWYYFENIVCDYLQNKWYKIIDRNFTIRWWEIDIIALKNNILCFVEVKWTKLNTDFSYHITEKKEYNLRKTAENWIMNNHHKIDVKWYRFDLVFVKNDKIVEHMKWFI